MSDELAESILRKIVDDGIDGGGVLAIRGLTGVDTFINVNLRLTPEEEAYLRGLIAAVERDPETEA